MRGLSLVFALFSLASAFRHHHNMRRALSSLSLPTSLLSISVLPTSIPVSLSSSSPSPPPPSPSLQSSSPSPSLPTPAPTSSLSSSSSSASSPAPSPISPTASTPSTTTTATSASITPPSDSTPTPTPPIAGGVSDPSSASSVVVLASATITPSSTAENSASPGFFSNTGAVAGTFTAVGLIAVAGLIAVVLFVLRRRHSRSYEEDMEYLDKSLNRSSDPPMNQVTSVDDGFTSDHGHFSASPMAVPSPPAVYYPDSIHVLQPQAFSPDVPGSNAYHPGYTQDFPPQHVYSSDDYDISYPPLAPHVQPNMPNPHEFSDVELVSAPVPQTQAVPPAVLRPSVRPTQSIPRQWENTRFSVDSFYVGIETDHPSRTGQAL